MDDVQPITPDSEICQVLNCLPEKFIVDFANGIDISRDHLRVQRARGQFFERCYDGFTGQGAQRQEKINANLIEGLEGSLNWLIDLSNSLSNSNLALSKVNDRVNELMHDTARITDYSINTRRQLESLSMQLNQRCARLEEDLVRIDFIQRVQLNLDSVFNKWRAGRYRSFSPSGRCYAALQELHWGDFGDYCRSTTGTERHKFLEDLTNRAISQLAEDSDTNPLNREDTRRWLVRPIGRHVLADAADALIYLGCEADPMHSPFVFSTTQVPSELPLNLPRLSSVERITEALVSEVFTENSYA